jgi:amidase
VPFAHGSDGSGSLRFPASLCGVATLKPSRGRISSSAAGGSPDPLDLWTQFVVARDVRDLVALFGHLGSDIDESSPSRHGGLRVGFVTTDPIIGLDVDTACGRAVETVSATLAEAGHVVEASFPSAFTTLFEPFWAAMSTIGPWVRAGQVEWVSQQLGRPCRSGDLSDEVLALADRGRSLSKQAVDAALEEVTAAMAPVADWWDDGQDVLVSPVTLQPAWLLGEDAPMRTGMFAAPFSFTGQPAVVVPGGWTDDGRPVGVQLVGRPGADELLLDVALDLQRQIGWLDQHPPTPS